MDDPETRGYHSPLRAAQTERTRATILDTLAELVAEEGFEGVSVREVAGRCGVAERTVYRHFPDREALQDGLVQRISDEQGWTSMPDELMRDLDAFPESIERAYDRFDDEAYATRIAARVLSSALRRAPSSSARHDALRSMVDRGLPELDDDDRRVITGILHVLASSRTWLRLQDEFGISGREAGPALRWLTGLLVRELRAEGGIPDRSAG